MNLENLLSGALGALIVSVLDFFFLRKQGKLEERVTCLEEGKLVGWGRGFFVRYRLERKNAAQKGPASVPGAAIDSALGSPLPSSGSPQTPKKQ